MSIQLRGHHLLCLLGFRGMGYSEPFANNMLGIYQQLYDEPTTRITIVSGVDDLCACFPSDQVNHCHNHLVHERDAFILKQLGVANGDCLPWEQVLSIVQSSVKPEDIPKWCSTCQWLSYGVCEEGIARIARGEGMLKL